MRVAVIATSMQPFVRVWVFFYRHVRQD